MSLFPRGAIALLTLILAPPALSQTVRQLTSFPVDRLGEYALDDEGNAVIAVMTADPFGANPAHDHQAVAWTGAGAGSALTLFGGLGKTVSVTDDGQWIVFISMADPLGQNGGRDFAGFLQSADGSVLRQLGAWGSLARISGSGNRIVFSSGRVVDVSTGTSTQVAVGGESLSISDDGQIIVSSADGDPLGANADGGFEVFRVMADGSGLMQLTSSATEDATGAMISGNGQRVAYASGGQIFVVSASGGQPLLVGTGNHPSITDDGAWVYYSAPDEDNLEIYRSSVDTAVPQRLTRTSPPLSNDWPQVSGNGNRVAFVRHGTVEDPSARTLMRMDSNGSAVEQLGTAETDWRSWDAEITSDGRRIVFVGGASDRYDVFRVQADGSDLVQITHGAEALHPSVADDGETIVFQSALDLAGDNPCGTAQVFRIGADGSGLAQLSPSGDCVVCEYPMISRDGSTVVYQQDGTRLHALPAGGGSPVLVVTDSSTYPKMPRLSRDGSLVVYESIGSAPGGYVQAFLARTDGSLVEQVSRYPLWWTERPDISADGSRVAYSEWGLAHNYYYQDLWLYLPETGTRTALTEYYNAADTRISGDGEYLYHLEPTDDRLRRFRISTGQFESFSGLRDPRAAPLVPASAGNDTAFAVDGVGRVAFSWPVNWTDENPDLNQEIWLVDFQGTPRWDIEVTTPARVRFTPDPFGSTYDLIRGDLTNLGFGVDDTVDLGAVVCLASNTPTNSAMDPEGPAPNHGFFYLFRSSGGGGWGSSSSGSPRVPGSGGCP